MGVYWPVAEVLEGATVSEARAGTLVAGTNAEMGWPRISPRLFSRLSDRSEQPQRKASATDGTIEIAFCNTACMTTSIISATADAIPVLHRASGDRSKVFCHVGFVCLQAGNDARESAQSQQAGRSPEHGPIPSKRIDQHPSLRVDNAPGNPDQGKI